MISITSETSSVQRTSTEETKTDQQTNGNQIPNVNQMSNTNQTEELHIAEEATNKAGERSESRQSGAEHPNQEKSSAEQGFCKTASSESANKYTYTIFADWAGERYLKWILKQILPSALYRTWRAAVRHQAPGKPCYVGAATIAREEKVGERKAKIDFQELEARGLMQRYRQRHSWPQEDGTVKYGTVTVKDFSRLYALAYEYHLWINSPEYVEAEWDNAEDIKQDQRLCLKLLRFDNYRHILMCQKPGPKKGKRTLLQEVYHCQLPEEEQDPGAQTTRTSDQKGKDYFQPSGNPSSAYRESNKKESYVTKENSTSKENSEEGVFADVVREAIRNAQHQTQPEPETREQKTSEINEEKLKQEEIKKQERSERRWEESNTIETLQKEETARETAKEEEEYTIEDLKQNPMSMIAFLLQLNEQERAKQEQQQAKKKKRHHKDQPKRKRLGTPEQLALVITQIVQDLGDDPKFLKSNITRITKIYWACTQIFTGFNDNWFHDQLTKAFAQTCKYRKVSKRTPYFFTTLLNLLEMTNDERVYLRSEEALYCDGDLKAFLLRLQRRYEKSGSPLEYQEWVKQTYL